MRKIYIVLTFTGTILARIVRFYTRKKYSHVSIALDKDLVEMYSFGRLNPYNPFIGGFVHEGINIGTFGRFKNTKCRIKCLEITDEHYYKLNELINKFEKERENYKFNVIGLFAVSLNLKIQKENSFYCAEFIKHALEETNIVDKLPEIIIPDHFNNIENAKQIYEGLLREYKTY